MQVIMHGKSGLSGDQFLCNHMSDFMEQNRMTRLQFQILDSVYYQDVTHRSESIIGNLIDKSILLDFTR